MGKVISSFTNGFPGAIARALDDVVVAFANKSEGALAFGVPVALDATKTGITLFDPATHTAADFVGITVRNPSKTPETYGANTAAYASGELADVLGTDCVLVPWGHNSTERLEKTGRRVAHTLNELEDILTGMR